MSLLYASTALYSAGTVANPGGEMILHTGQAEILTYPARFKVAVCGRRWGKTQMAKVAVVRAARIPRRLIWYVAPTYRMAKDLFWSELMASLPMEWVVHANETLMIVRLINGTVIMLKGADKPDTLRGVGLHYLVIDEAQDIKEETWKRVLRPTLASTGGHALIIGTPKSFNWLYEVYMMGQNSRLRHTGEWCSWQMPTITSPFIPDSEVEQARSDMDEKSFKQEFEANFETMSGRVYYQFDRHIHVKRCTLNKKLPIWIGMDFNVDPMSAVVMQPGADGVIRAVREIVLPSSSTEEIAEELERLYWRHMKKLYIYPDPAGAYRSSGRGESDLDILRDKGFKKIKHKKKHPRVANRVNSVNRMLKSARGEVRFLIDPSCTHTVESFEQTVYRSGSREIDKGPSIEHATDALGYMMEYEFPVRKFVPMGVSV